MTSTSRFKLKLTPRTQLKQKIVPGLPQAGDGTLVKFDVENGVYIPRLDLSGLPLQSAPDSGRESDTYFATYNTTTGDYGLNQYQGLLDAAAAQAEAATLLRTRPVFNVKNYAGIVNDGTSSDQTAIDAALADAVAANGVLYFPASDNAYRGKIVVPDGTHGLSIVGDGFGASELFIAANNDHALEINSPTFSGGITHVTVTGLKLHSTGSGVALKIWNTLFFNIIDCDLLAEGVGTDSLALDIQGSQGILSNVTGSSGGQAAAIGNGGGTLTNAGPIVFVGGQLGMNHGGGVGGALKIEGDPLCVAFIGTLFHSSDGDGATSTGAVQIDGPSSGTPVGDVAFINCRMESVHNTTNTLAGFEIGKTHKAGQVRIVGGNYWGHGEGGATYAQDLVRCYGATNLIVEGVTASKLGNTHGWSRSLIRHESSGTPSRYSYRANDKSDIEGAMYSDADGVLTGETGDATNINQTVTGTIRNTGLGAGYVKSNSSGQFSSGTVTPSDISGLGSGVAAFLATPSSANLRTALTDETGTGSAVFATSPTLVTPALGTPSSVTLTNATGLPVATGISGLGTGVAAFLATPSSANLASALTDETGSGAAVFATSPTLVTPNLGTPSAATLTNATGLPISTGVSGLGTGVATFLATPSSANLRAALTDEVGTGAAYFVGGALGTPASATLTNATGLPVSTGISGLGSGVAAFLATPSSANLASAVTDETGTGALVFATSPTLVTPNIGAATATTINGAAFDNNAWTAYTPTLSATSGTFTSASATGKYQQRGKTVFFQVVITITTAGTATGFLFFTTPTTVQSGGAFFFPGINQAAAQINSYIIGSGTQVSVVNTNGSGLIANGVTLYISGTYEST